MQMTKKQLRIRILLAIIFIAILPVLIFKFNLLQLIYKIPPEWFSALILYVVFVWPQYNSLYALKIVQEQEEDTDVRVEPNYFNWFPIYNDIQLTRFFGYDTIIRKVLNFAMLASLGLFTVCLLYVDGLVIIMPNLTLLEYANYLLMPSLLVYYISKVLVMGYFINMFGGVLWAITSVIHPIGFLALTSRVKMYITGRSEVQRERSMGLEIDG